MSRNTIAWLKFKVFPETVEARSFGVDVKKFVSFEPNNQKAIDQYMSEVVFGDVTVEKANGQLVTESVVIKYQPTLEMGHRILDCDASFYNEVLFYSELIPLLQKYDTNNVLTKNFCEYVYGKATNGQSPEEDVIILKNLSKKGFKLTDERLFIDEKHIKLALDTIAKFHALSFKCRLDDPKGFFSFASKIENPHKKLDEKIFPENFLTLCMIRGIEHLKNDPKYKDRLSPIYKRCRKNGWWEKYEGPLGYLNVIAHGDFTRNNMMFKYGSNGEPLEVIFFDMALLKYCPLAIDTSCFLFLNASPEVRKLRWNDFLQTYYNALSNQLDGHPVKPSFEDVELDMRRKGIYGYHVCAFILPLFMEFKTKEDWAEYFQKDRLMQNVNRTGGSVVTEYLAEMVRHMLDKNYIFD